MLTQPQDDILRPIVRRFIDSQDGRFREHVSDVFLEALIMRELGRYLPGPAGMPSFGQAILDGREGMAYQAVCYIFESLLEHACGIIMNGHHRAQAFEAMFKEFQKP